MKPFKLTYGILATGIFILILSTLAGTSILSKYNEICGVYGTGKVSANLLDNLDPKGNSALKLEDIRHLREFSFKGMDMSYASEGKVIAAYEEDQAQANISGVSDMYNMFHQIRMKSGSFITSGNKKEMVAVVDEDLAIELFNNTNVVGMYLELYDRKYKIIGVAASDLSIAQTLTDNGYGSIYIPVEHMLEYDTNSKITSLEIRAADMGTTGININKMKDGLASISKNAADYNILDHSIEKKLMEEKAQASIFISGIGIIIILLHSIKKRVKEIYTTIRSALKDHYLKDVLRLKYIKLVLIFAEAVAVLTFILVVWNTVKFSLYIPTQYVPDELIDIEFFTDLFESLMQKNVNSVGDIPSLMEMKASVLGILQNWSLIVGVFVGFPSYCLGLKMLELKQEDTRNHMLYSCIFIAFSIALSLLILKIFNMPIEVNTGNLLIVSAFIMLSALRLEQSFQGSN